MQLGCHKAGLRGTTMPMHVSLEPPFSAPNRGRPVLSVGPAHEREGGRAVPSGVLAIENCLMALRPVWELLLQGLP